MPKKTVHKARLRTSHSSHQAKKSRPSTPLRAHRQGGDKPVIELTVKEFPHHQKNNLWYLGMGIIILSGLFLAIRSHNYTFALVVIAAGLAIFRLSDLRPPTREVRLTTTGVFWGDQFHPYHRLKAFWAAATGDQFSVYLEPINLQPTIHFQLPENQADSVMFFLHHFLPWHDHKSEPLSDRLSRFLRL